MLWWWAPMICEQQKSHDRCVWEHFERDRLGGVFKKANINNISFDVQIAALVQLGVVSEKKPQHFVMNSSFTIIMPLIKPACLKTQSKRIEVLFWEQDIGAPGFREEMIAFIYYSIHFLLCLIWNICQSRIICHFRISMMH